MVGIDVNWLEFGDEKPLPRVEAPGRDPATLAANMTVEEATARLPKEAGVGRYGKPEEIVELMALPVSPGARWMSGSTLRMDGGELKSIWPKPAG